MNGDMSRTSAEKGERDWGRMDGRDMDIGAQVLRIGTGEEEQSLHERERTSSPRSLAMPFVFHLVFLYLGYFRTNPYY